MFFFKNFRILESLQGLFPSLFIIFSLAPSFIFRNNHINYFFLFTTLFLSHQFIFLINDFYDYPTDLANPRKHYITALNQTKRSFFIFSTIFFYGLSFLIFQEQIHFFIIIGFFFFLGILYSYPKTHFKSKKMLSFLIHFIYGFLGSTAGFFFLIESHLIDRFPIFLCILSGSSFGFLFMAGNIMSVILDQNIELKSWLKSPSSNLLVQYKNLLYICIFLLATFDFLLLKQNFIYLIPVYLFFALRLSKIISKVLFYKTNQKGFTTIRDKIRLSFFLFFIFKFILTLSMD